MASFNAISLDSQEENTDRRHLKQKVPWRKSIGLPWCVGLWEMTVVVVQGTGQLWLMYVRVFFCITFIYNDQ
jgi:hypothetical protein